MGLHTAFRLERMAQILKTPRHAFAVLCAAILCALWTTLIYQAVADRAEAPDHAHSLLTAYATAYANNAVSLTDHESNGKQPRFSARAAAELNNYWRTTPLSRGFHLRLWRSNGEWLAGDRPVAGRDLLPLSPWRNDGRLLIVSVARPQIGVVAEAYIALDDALARWRSDYAPRFGILFILTLVSLLIWLVAQHGRKKGGQANRRWRALFNDNLDCNFMIQTLRNDPTGSSWPVIEMNASAKALLQEWAPQAASGPGMTDKAPAWARSIIAEKLSISAFTNTSITHRFASIDRTTCYVLTSVPVCERDGSVSQVILRIRDISDREQKDVEFENAIFRAEEASRAKSAILANTSHELRTPLNAVMGYSELMQLGIGGQLTPKQEEYVKIIHGSGKHLLDIITDILDLAKIESGRFELHEEAADLKEIGEVCIDLVKMRVGAKDLNLYADISDMPLLRVDPVRLKQILVNLLSNAVKFTERGEVTLTAARTEAGGVSLIVADTGVGMTDEELALALEPFRQVDSGKACHHEGTGLGLPIAKKLTMLHGGTFVVNTEKGVGTQVILSFGSERVELPDAPRQSASG